LAAQTSFTVDVDQVVYLVKGTAVVPADPELALPLLAYLNSSVADSYLRALTPVFRGAFQKFEPQHLEQLPVPPFLVQLDTVTQRLGDLAHQVLEARRAGDEATAHLAESEIDQVVSDAVAFTGLD
jgi:hypothetical protein